jgi:hypothetical protein
MTHLRNMGALNRYTGAVLRNNYPETFANGERLLFQLVEGDGFRAPAIPNAEGLCNFSAA